MVGGAWGVTTPWPALLTNIPEDVTAHLPPSGIPTTAHILVRTFERTLHRRCI